MPFLPNAHHYKYMTIRYCTKFWIQRESVLTFIIIVIVVVIFGFSKSIGLFAVDAQVESKI